MDLFWDCDFGDVMVSLHFSFIYSRANYYCPSYSSKNLEKNYFPVFLGRHHISPMASGIYESSYKTNSLVYPFTLESFIASFYFSLLGWNVPHVFGLFALFLIINLLIFLIFSYSAKLIVSRPHIKLFDINNIIHPEFRNSSPSGEWLNTGNRIRLILFISFMAPLTLMIIVSIYKQNIIIYRTFSLIVPTFIMWLVYHFVVNKPNIFHKAIWFGSICIVVVGILYWSPTQVGSGMKELSAIVENSFKSTDAFYHNTGLTALIFKYYFPDRPQYLIDGNDTLGLLDLRETKTNIQDLAPEKVPAKRLWVVWTRAKDLETINMTSDKRTRELVQNCQLISVLNYPESWNVEVYLCELH